MNLTGSGVVAVAAVAAAAVVGVVIWRNRDALARAVNPAAPENIVNRGVTAAVSSATGRPESLGGLIADWVFDVTHPGFWDGMTAPKNPAKPVMVPADDSGLAVP